MGDVTILTEADLRRAVPLDGRVVDAVRSAFAALSTDEAVMPPVLSMVLPEVHGEVDVKTAYLPEFSSFAVKISPGFFDNPALGLPSLNGLMVVFSAQTGMAEALLLDNGYLTDVRTAAAGAVAADHLARRDASCVAILGSGVQARLQLEALCLVRNVRQVRIWSRDPDKAAKLAALLGRERLKVAAVAEAETAVKGADIIVTTTPAQEPILRSVWLEPGQHVTAVGSDGPHKNELEPRVLAYADLYVTDRTLQCELLGEMRSALAAGLTVEPVELSTIVIGAHPGRTSDYALTVADLTGTGAQDTAIANLALLAGLGQGLGYAIKT